MSCAWCQSNSLQVKVTRNSHVHLRCTHKRTIVSPEYHFDSRLTIHVQGTCGWNIEALYRCFVEYVSFLLSKREVWTCACVYFCPKNCFLSEMKQQGKFCECADDLYCTVNLFNKTFRLLLIENNFVDGDLVVNCFLSKLVFLIILMQWCLLLCSN